MKYSTKRFVTSDFIHMLVKQTAAEQNRTMKSFVEEAVSKLLLSQYMEKIVMTQRGLSNQQ